METKNLNKSVRFPLKYLFFLLVILIALFSVLPVFKSSFTGTTGNLLSRGYISHTVTFALAAGCGMLAYRGRFRWLLGAILVCYGVVLEFIQYFLPCRTYNPQDILANIIGIGLVMFLFGLANLWSRFFLPHMNR